MISCIPVRLRIAFALLLMTVGFAPAAFAVTELRTLIDIDNSDATGCAVLTAAGTFSGADFELVSKVDTSVDPPVVTQQSLNQCVGVALVPYAGPNPFTRFTPPWPAGLDSGLDAIEAYVPLNIGNLGSAIQLGFTSNLEGSPRKSGDALLSTDGGPAPGAPIILGVPVAEIPTLGEWGLLTLAVLLLGAGCVTVRRRRSRTALLVGLLLLSAGLGVAVAAANHAPDGNLADWQGHDPIAVDAPPSSPVNLEIRRAFATIENGILFIRIDIDANPNLAPTANDDAATVNEDAAATPIPVLANDADPEGDPFTIASVTQPANGTVVITGGGTGLTYKPNAN